MKKQGKSAPSHAACQAPEILGDPCNQLIAPGNHKYCARHHELASLLAKRRDRAAWRASGDKYWLDSPLRVSPSRADYMRDWRLRRKQRLAIANAALTQARNSDDTHNSCD